MTEHKTDFRLNGANDFVSMQEKAPVRLWRKIQMNEWTFSLFLFVVSLSIVLGKLCINYGNVLLRQGNARYDLPSLSVASSVPDTFGIPKVVDLSRLNAERLTAAREKFVNISSHYEDVVASAVTSFYSRYGWLLRAAISGLVMMGFTWFIIYKDSSIPGVNPPSPFSPSKRRVPEASRVQMNYLVGALNGILIFIYMCL